MSIGFDPVLWVERLRDVARDSGFTPNEKVKIDGHLKALLLDLNDPSYANFRANYVVNK